MANLSCHILRYCFILSLLDNIYILDEIPTCEEVARRIIERRTIAERHLKVQNRHIQRRGLRVETTSVTSSLSLFLFYFILSYLVV